MRTKTIIGISLILLFAVFAFHSFSAALNPYVTFAQAAHTGRTVQVLGYLTGEEITYDLENKHLRFYLTDEEGTRTLITYEGAKPNNMEHAESIVVMGRIEEGVFLAQKMLVKCPSKYEEEKESVKK
ncbi:MAG: cytochrome c maturation protein CcmE [Bacillota bacterium]